MWLEGAPDGGKFGWAREHVQEKHDIKLCTVVAAQVPISDLKDSPSTTLV